MGLIPQTFIDELIARADIVEVIGSRLKLKKAGREFKACCPFHNEKSASFWVSPEKQFYHCFGCGAHGQVLRFLMEHDHMAFPAAVAELLLILERDRGEIRDGDRHYDRFRDRIMFPIRDGRGRIIAFGGRILDQGEPKYLNSPETLLFPQGRELYGLYEARRSRPNLKRLLIVEGYMDAVRLHQYGINYAVATLGTATTPEHLKRILRLVSEVVFAFDGDRAGRAAAWRALQHALPEARQGREIRFLFLPDGHDPDSLVGEEGAEAFERRLDATLPLSEYLIRELSEQSDLSHADGRARFSESARPLWSKLPEGVYREVMLG